MSKGSWDRAIFVTAKCLADSQKGPKSRCRTLGELELEQSLFTDVWQRKDPSKCGT